MQVNPDELVSLIDIADMFGLTPAAVTNWRNRHADFPKPVVTVARGHCPLFLHSEVVGWWAKRHPRALLTQTIGQLDKAR